MYYDNLPIFKSALDLVVYIETIVKGFERYHKYTIGVLLPMPTILPMLGMSISTTATPTTTISQTTTIMCVV